MADESAGSTVDGLVEKRWTRFGHDRVYLSTLEEVQVGYIDLKTRTLEMDDPAFEAVGRRSLARWCPDTEPEPSAVATGSGKSSDGLPKLIKAKRDSDCTACGSTVAKGDDLFWIPNTKVAVCPACTAGEVAAGLDSGTPGGAATRIADGAARKNAERLLAAYPMLGKHLVDNARPTANMHAWMRGADGERIVGRKLDIAAESGQLIVLHDRQMPGGGNIDHLVIGPRRISVVDAKHYRGARITRSDDKLTIAGKPSEHLVDGIRRQQAAVCDVLSDRPRVADNVFAIMAFVGGKFGFTDCFMHRGVWCSTVKEAVSYAAWRHRTIGTATLKLDEDDRREIAELLAGAFPSC